MPKRGPLTPRRLRAQRSNASRSTGPKTREGRRRAALNQRTFVFSKAGWEIIERLKGDPQEFQRIWRDLLGIFEFMGPHMEPYLPTLAGEWWLKAHYARRDLTPEALQGREERLLRIIDARLETELWEMVGAYQIMNRQWRYRLEHELGSSGRAGVGRLRLAVETRLRTFQILAAEGKLPPISPLEQVLSEAAEDLRDFGVAL